MSSNEHVPQPENVILVKLTIMDVTLAEFGMVEKSFLDALLSLLQHHTLIDASVEIHTVMENAEHDEIM